MRSQVDSHSSSCWVITGPRCIQFDACLYWVRVAAHVLLNKLAETMYSWQEKFKNDIRLNVYIKSDY